MNNPALPGRKSDVNAAEDVTFIDPDFEDITELQADIDDTLNSITSEFDADSRDAVVFMKIYRVQEKTGKSAWLFNCQPEELPIMEKLRDQYGSGIFQVRVYKNKKLYRRFNYQIEAPKGVIPVSNNSGNIDFAAIIAAMQTQSERNFQQMKELLLARQGAPGIAPEFNPMKMMEGLAGALAAFQNLMPKPAVDPMIMFTKGIELASNFSGNGKETNFLDLLRDLIPVAGEAIKVAATQVPPNKTGSISPRLNSPDRSNDLKKPATSGGNAVDLSPIKPHVDFLVNKALSGSDPALYADMIMDSVPLETVKQYLIQDSLLTDLMKINPRVQECEAWFVTLKNELLQIISEDQPENLTPTTAVPDTNNNASEQPNATNAINGATSGGEGS